MSVTIRELYNTVQARRRPEDVAAMIEAFRGAVLSRTERETLQQAVHHAGRGLGYTSMMKDFSRPVGLQNAIHKAAQPHLFPSVSAPAARDCDRPEAMHAFVASCESRISKRVGGNSFQADRLSAPARREIGLQLSRRQYNRLWRFAARLEAKVEQLERNWQKYECIRAGKTKLVTRLPVEEFDRDPDTACFIAYFAARCNLRMEFTIMGQTRPFDKICEMLFARCRRSTTTNWWAIAHIYPEAEVLSHLSEAQQGELLGRYFNLLSDVGELLRETWTASNINQATMIVRRGNDSSTWNAGAGAWNRARDGWIALLHSLGAADVLDTLCPGKVLLLVAGDLAFLHSHFGKGLHPDTPVWNDLPLPWQVLRGETQCGRELVEAVCRRHNVDPQKNGWTAPRPKGRAVAFQPTPELVHGVTVSSPQLATLLREAGVFSGKKFKGFTLPHESP